MADTTQDQQQQQPPPPPPPPPPEQPHPQPGGTVGEPDTADMMVDAAAAGTPGAPTSETQSQTGAVEIDSEADSAFGDDLGSETTSIASSIFHHRYENGRTYHAYKDGKYIMPNDELEQDRLDIHHHIAMLHLGGDLYLAPIGDNPGRILDLGTGTGLWAIDMADKFPNAEVLGIDLSPSQPSWVPPNVRFEVDDMEEPWTFSQPFDFIHARYLAGSVYDWKKLARQCFEHLKPGGWVEFKDWDVRAYGADGSRNIPDNYVKKWHDEILSACVDFGVTPYPALIIKDVAKEAGFKTIHEQIFQVPIGGWPKDKKLKLIGKFYGVTLHEGAEGMSLRLLTQLRHWDVEEVHVLNARFRADMKTFPFYHKYHVIWCQKPFENTAEGEG